MARVKGKDTKPEMLIRRALHAEGFRYSLHSKRLPGHPDIVLRKYRAIVLVHGCFWHDHGCYKSTKPKAGSIDWKRKFRENRERDRRNIDSYLQLGWRVLVVWECAIVGKTKWDFDELIKEISNWIESGRSYREIEGIG